MASASQGRECLMSGLAVTALVVACLWLLALTVVLLALVRQVAILTVKGRQYAVGDSLEVGGPVVGSRLPADLVLLAPVLASGEGHVLLLSASCSSCRELANQLGRSVLKPSVVALLPGPPASTETLAQLLPTNMTVIRDPSASQLAEQLNITSTPFAVTVSEQTVTEKGHVYEPRVLLPHLAERTPSPSRS